MHNIDVVKNNFKICFHCWVCIVNFLWYQIVDLLTLLTGFRLGAVFLPRVGAKSSWLIVSRFLLICLRLVDVRGRPMIWMISLVSVTRRHGNYSSNWANQDQGLLNFSFKLEFFCSASISKSFKLKTIRLRIRMLFSVAS